MSEAQKCTRARVCTTEKKKKLTRMAPEHENPRVTIGVLNESIKRVVRFQGGKPQKKTRKLGSTRVRGDAHGR